MIKKRNHYGSNNPRWNGGVRIRNGYRSIYCPDHPNSRNRYVLEHRLVMENKIGRLLNKNEVVHHINHDKKDNRIENLELMTNSEHTKHHIKDILTKEVRKKRSLSLKKQFKKGIKPKNFDWTGKNHSKETKLKMKLAAKEVWRKRKIEASN